MGAAASLLCTPAIVRAANLMPVRRLPFPYGPQYAGFVDRLFLHELESSLEAGLLAGRTNIEVGGRTIPADSARRQVALRRHMDFCRRTFAYTAVIEDVSRWRISKLRSLAATPHRSISRIAVLHIPHSSQRVPAAKRQAILSDDAALSTFRWSVSEIDNADGSDAELQ